MAGLNIAAGTTISVSANATSADQVQPQYQYPGKGVYTLYARSSATGLNVTLSVNGITMVKDLPIPFFGTTGGLSKNDHEIIQQAMENGRAELTFRNTTGGALTVDYLLNFVPLR